MKYEKIMNDMIARMAQGELKPGSKLPSIRQLAETYGCSRNSVIKAYGELEKKHLIYASAKRGYYVVDTSVLKNEPAGISEVIDFQEAGPDRSAMPYRDFQHCINQAIDTYKEEMFLYSDVQGMLSLRIQLARQLQELQVFTDPRRIFVLTGSQQGLDLLITLPFPNGKANLCVEQPTHPSMIQALVHRQAKVYGVEVADQGVDMAYLEHIFKTKDIKFFYTVSRFHNPTGYSYSNKEKQKIVELAQKYDVYIVEDDYLGDLDPNRKADPMFAYDTSGRVLYTKSFSKTLLPGLRLGLLVLPDSMIDRFARAKFGADIHTPALSQGALELYLKNGMFESHIVKLREVYTRKGTILKQAYQQYLPGDVTCLGACGGFYSSLILPDRVSVQRLIPLLKEKRVLVGDATKQYMPGTRKKPMLRLSVSQVKEDQIAPGVKRIAEAIAALREPIIWR